MTSRNWDIVCAFEQMKARIAALSPAEKELLKKKLYTRRVTIDIDGYAPIWFCAAESESAERVPELIM